MKILLTGGSGFIGSHIAEQLSEEGHAVRVLVRATSKVDHLKKLPGVELAYGAVDDRASLDAAVHGVEAVIHGAAMVKARNEAELQGCNVTGTENLLGAVREHAPDVRRFVLISSLAAAAPSPDGTPVAVDVTPAPVTAYGRSKLAAERASLAVADRFPITIIRPPMVYGPRDTEVYQLFVLAARRVLPYIGAPEGKLSLIYGPDCARACVRAVFADVPSGKTYYVTDGTIYTRREMIAGLEQAVGKKAWVSFPLPAGVVRAAALATESYGRMNNRAVMLTRQKVDELLGQWVCDGSDAERDLAFGPTVAWAEGSRRTAAWYREHGLL